MSRHKLTPEEKIISTEKRKVYRKTYNKVYNATPKAKAKRATPERKTD